MHTSCFTGRFKWGTKLCHKSNPPCLHRTSLQEVSAKRRKPKEHIIERTISWTVTAHATHNTLEKNKRKKHECACVREEGSEEEQEMSQEPVQVSGASSQWSQSNCRTAVCSWWKERRVGWKTKAKWWKVKNDYREDGVTLYPLKPRKHYTYSEETRFKKYTFCHTVTYTHTRTAQEEYTIFCIKTTDKLSFHWCSITCGYHMIREFRPHICVSCSTFTHLHYSGGMYLCKGRSLLLILCALISGFNPI